MIPLKKTSLFTFVIALIVSSCGSDNSSSANSTPTAQSLTDLGECSTSKEGNVVWIESENKGYICSMGNWIFDAQVKNQNKENASTETNTITDSRDGQKYKIVVFDGIKWFAQNLNYAIANTDSISSKCYNDDPAYCPKNGRLYTRAAAALPNICPEGYQIINGDAWAWLKSNYESRLLKATTDWAYWNDAINPTNITGLGLGPTGFCTSYNECSALGYEGRFWTLSGNKNKGFAAVYYNTNTINDSLVSLSNSDYFSIRCMSLDEPCSKEKIGTKRNILGTSYSCDGSNWTLTKNIDICSLPSIFFLNPNINYGSFQDARDGKTYKTVVIGSKTWMAENLRYTGSFGICSCGYGVSYNAFQPQCTDNVLGVFYDWSTAMGFDTTFNHVEATFAIQHPHRGICPEGWHIPNKDEWNTLANIPLISLISKACSGGYLLTELDDIYGFSAVPSTCISGVYLFDHFWSADEYDASTAIIKPVGIPAASPNYIYEKPIDDLNYPSLLTINKAASAYVNVRCVKD